MSKYRVGIVGCGGISRAHARAYQAAGNTEIVCCADIKAEAANKFGKEFNIPENAQYLNYEEMLKAEKLDIISISTWHGTHAPITIDACKAGVKGVLCDKPMSTCLRYADSMLEAAAASGAKLAINHQGRFSPVQVIARELIKAGAIGQPTAAFRRTGDGLLNNGSHAIDGVRYILGDPKTDWVIGQVSRHTDKWERRVRVEDCCMGLVCFEGGTRLVIESDLTQPAVHGPTVYGSIYGTEGTIRIDQSAVYLMNNEQAGWREIKPGQPVANAEASPNQVTELTAWIEGRIEEHRSSGRQARATLEIMMAIYESLRIHDVVHLPLQTKESPLQLMIDGGALPVTKPGKYDIRVPF